MNVFLSAHLRCRARLGKRKIGPPMRPRQSCRTRLAAGIAALLLVAGAPLPAAADDGTPAAVTKLTRGITNVALGLPGEILNGVVREAHSSEGLSSTGSYTAHFLAGLIMGIGWGFARVGSGFVDVVTFPIPFNDNRPLVEPDYIG